MYFEVLKNNGYLAMWTFHRLQNWLWSLLFECKQSSLIWIIYKFINAADTGYYQNDKSWKLQFSKYFKN